ncbi:hypothetical protein COLO4_28300 [Corchorus olitorius]|uniref:Uncharacterized protein n=1 Tax=Corchorus olitorius TaxID=93759 RepID=A0A1R3HLT9_9ROSI|nr:hypothetical protein COLO4_28300 [Corchorus olitorius]
MGMPCAREVFTSIFIVGAVTKKCCGELMVLGLAAQVSFHPKFPTLKRGFPDFDSFL